MKISPPIVLVDARAFLGEGPSWDGARRVLYWVDIHAGDLHVLDPEQGRDEVVPLGAPLGCVAPARGGGLVAAVGRHIARVAVDPTGPPPRAVLTVLAEPEPHLPGNRFNDGKCDPHGRFLVGTMDDAEKEASGSLYSFAPGSAPRILLRGLRITNGLAWSPDHRTLYHVDTPTRTITAHDYDLSTGQIAGARVAVSVPEELGWPDGMTSDTEGRLWVAMWGGAAVTVWNPQRGTLVERIPIPAGNVTACTFGGDAGTDLYVTSARKRMSRAELERYPASGAVFRLRTDVRGMPTFAFAD